MRTYSRVILVVIFFSTQFFAQAETVDKSRETAITRAIKKVGPAV